MDFVKSSCIILFVSLAFCHLQSQSNASFVLPNVFIIGDHVEEYEKLCMQNVNLLEICDDNMKLAFDGWMHMLERMDDFSQEVGVDLKGLKLWLNIFWDQEGRIKHLAYYPKPNSKQLEYPILTAFFENFVKSYQLPIQADQSFTHYGSASFPTLSDRLASKNQQN